MRENVGALNTAATVGHQPSPPRAKAKAKAKATKMIHFMNCEKQTKDQGWTNSA